MTVDDVNNKIQRLPTPSTAADLCSKRVGRREFRSPELGAYFVSIRPEGWNPSLAAGVAKRRGIPISRNIILRLEQGTTQHIEPSVLRAIADLYRRDYREVVETYASLYYRLGDPPAQSAPDPDLKYAGVLSEPEVRTLLDAMRHLTPSLLVLAARGALGFVTELGSTRVRGSSPEKTPATGTTKARARRR